MNSPAGAHPPRTIRNIFLASDFSEASEVAFAHALKLALIARATLSILHVSTNGIADWTEYPGVRATLERWGILPPGSARSALGWLGIEVRKVLAKDRDPVRAVLGYLAEHPTDLIVLATHHYDGPVRWQRKPVATPIARGASEMTLFIPQGTTGFVSQRDGSVSLRNFLIPIDSRPRPDSAVEAACRTAWALQCPTATFTTVHVGAASGMPVVREEAHDDWSWRRVLRQGDVVDIIAQVATETSADLIVMATAGQHGFLDALRGTTTERVLRRARCPLLAVPTSGD